MFEFTFHAFGVQTSKLNMRINALSTKYFYTFSEEVSCFPFSTIDSPDSIIACSLYTRFWFGKYNFSLIRIRGKIPFPTSCFNEIIQNP